MVLVVALVERRLARLVKCSTFSSWVLYTEIFGGEAGVVVSRGGWEKIWVLFMLKSRPSCLYTMSKASKSSCRSSSEWATRALASAYHGSMTDVVVVLPLALNLSILKS